MLYITILYKLLFHGNGQTSNLHLAGKVCQQSAYILYLVSYNGVFSTDNDLISVGF